MNKLYYMIELHFVILFIKFIGNMDYYNTDTDLKALKGFKDT